MDRIKAVPIGIRMLSFNLGVENSSITVTENAVNMVSKIDAADKKYIIMYVVMANARVPSKDLLNNCVFPYLIPMSAAAESEKLKTRMAITAIFSLNSSVVIPTPIKTQDAPDNE